MPFLLRRREFCSEKSGLRSFSINFLEDDGVILTFEDNSSIISLIGACLSSLTPARLLLVWDAPLDGNIHPKAVKEAVMLL